MARLWNHLILIVISLAAAGCSLSVEMMGLSSKATDQFELISSHSTHANISVWPIQLKDHLKSGKVPTEDDFIVVNGDITLIQEVQPGLFDITVTPQADGLTRVELKKTFSGLNTSSGTSPDAVSVIIDRVAPTVVLSHSESAMTDQRTVAVTATFSEDVTSVQAVALQITNGHVELISGSGSIYTILIAADAEGPVDVVFQAEGTSDPAGNKNPLASTSVGWTYNPTVPLITVSSCQISETTSPVVLTFTANEDVMNFTAADIAVSGANLGNFLKVDDSHYSAELTALAQGAVSVSIAENTYTDIYGLANDTATECEFVYDSIAPTLTLSALPAYTAVSPQVVTVTLSEPVQKFDLTVLTLSNATAVVTGSGTSFSIELFPIIEGAYGVAVAAGAVQDQVGNANATTQSVSGVYDVTPPVGVLSPESGAYSFGTPVFFLLSYNEAVTGIDAGDDFVISGGSFIGMTGGAGSKNYILRIMPWGPGVLSVSVKGARATNLAGLTQASPIVAETTYYDDSAVVVQFSDRETYLDETDTSNKQLQITMRDGAGALATKPYEVEVFFSVVGDAVPDTDFVLATRSVKIPAHTSTATIPYRLLHNTAVNKNTYFQLNLYYANSPAIQMGRIYQARVLINDLEGQAGRPTVLSYHARFQRKCVIDSLSDLRCWGVNDNGMVGDGTTISRDVPVVVDAGVKYKLVAHGINQTCGITLGGILKCWGVNGWVGRSPLPTGTQGFMPQPVTSAETYTQVSLGFTRGCAITTGGAVDCWKFNQTPTRVPGTDLAEKFVKIEVAGADMACAITENTNTYCWGTVNQWGVQTIPASETATLIYNDVIKITFASGADAGCYLKNDYRLYCWTSGVRYGMGGQGESVPNSFTAGLVSGGHLYDDVSAGGKHICALRRSAPAGAVDCWGERGDRGTTDLGLGDKLGYRVHEPSLVDSASSFVSVVASDASTCGITTDGKLKCWGDYLGDGARQMSLTPNAADSREDYKSVKAGRGYACGILMDGKLKCWGSRHVNDYIAAAIGDGTMFWRSSPVVIDRGREYTKVTTEGSTTCGLRENQGLYCWGSATNGIAANMGEGSPFQKVLLPTRVGNESYIDVAMGPATGNDFNHIACAVRVDGQIACWGKNPSDSSVVWTPTLVVDGTVRYKKVAAGGFHACGLTEEGSLRCWGYNDNRVLGIKVSGVTPAPANFFASPVAVQEVAGIVFTDVQAGERFSCALSADNDIYCWGSATSYSTGLGSNAIRETPTKLTSLTAGVSDKFNKLSVGAQNACGLTTSGVVKCWGSNANGITGMNMSSSSTMTPQAIVDSDLYKDVSMGAYFACGVTVAHKLKCWGSNAASTLGDDNVHRSWAAPVDVTNWIFP